MEIKYLIDAEDGKYTTIDRSIPLIKINEEGTIFQTSGIKKAYDDCKYYYDVTEIIISQLENPQDKIYSKGTFISRLADYTTIVEVEKNKITKIVRNPKINNKTGRIVSLYPISLDERRQMFVQSKGELRKYMVDLIEVDGGYKIEPGSNYYDLSCWILDCELREKCGDYIIELIYGKDNIYRVMGEEKDLIVTKPKQKTKKYKK